MKGLMTAVCLFTVTGSAWAQPDEIQPEGLIQLSIGQAKAFQFEQPVGGIYFAPKDIVEGTPQSDKLFTISPLTSGATRMFVRDATGKLIYNADIIVTPETGHLVKVYGSNKNDDLNGGYTATYCTEIGCERPDKDLPKPTAIAVERISRFKDGAVGTR